MKKLFFSFVLAALLGVVLTGCAAKEPREILPQKEWRETPFTRIRLIIPVGKQEQVAEVWLQAEPQETKLYRLNGNGGWDVYATSQDRKVERRLPGEVYYPSHGEAVPIGRYNLMKGDVHLFTYERF